MGWPLVNHAADKVLIEMADASKPFKSMDWAMPKFELKGWLGWTYREMLCALSREAMMGFFSQVTCLL